MIEFQDKQQNFLNAYKENLVNYQSIALGKEEWFKNFNLKNDFDNYFYSKNIFKLLGVKSKKIEEEYFYYFIFNGREFFIKKNNRGNSVYLILDYNGTVFGSYTLIYQDYIVSELTDYLFILFKQNNQK